MICRLIRLRAELNQPVEAASRPPEHHRTNSTARRLPERSILPSARERERRSGLELILRHVEDPMVRIGARAFRASVRKRAALAPEGPASGSGRRWGRAGTGRCYGPIHPADLAIGNRHVVLAQAKEATHPDHNGFELSVPINDELRDVADLLAGVIVNIEPDQL
jgi:hypothetical protein